MRGRKVEEDRRRNLMNIQSEVEEENHPGAFFSSSLEFPEAEEVEIVGYWMLDDLECKECDLIALSCWNPITAADG
ncbi:hypothetical protein GE061_002630 [Apolygus lucorum]|uniref:Uncharacterized protein n=1 Tax=Apolygus lucorum TaxID=248454 RepID=A0A8S9X5A6_APOLU|nr:hypothetical protein GE061_002630 [Apolygus lucorum]